MELCNLSQPQGREFCSWCFRLCLFEESDNSLLNILNCIDVVIAENTSNNNSELFNIMMENKTHRTLSKIQGLAIAASEYVYLTSMLELGYSCFVEQIDYYLQSVLQITSKILNTPEKNILNQFNNKQEAEAKNKTIYDLNIHESMTVETDRDINFIVIRVHNGWIYRECISNGHVISTFVPCDKEINND